MNARRAVLVGARGAVEYWRRSEWEFLVCGEASEGIAMFDFDLRFATT